MEKINEKIVRPWGSYTNINGTNHTGYKVKKLVITKKNEFHYNLINKEVNIGLLLMEQQKLELAMTIILNKKSIHICTAGCFT